MRTVAEWIAKHDDQAVPPRVRLRILEKYGRRCACGCGRQIATGEPWQLDHITALANGGKHRESNMHPLLTEHHKRKTKDDVAIKKYHYQRRLANAGIKRRKSRPLLGTYASGWSITFSRGAVRR